MKFLDEAKVFIAAGHGGRGCVSFHREKFIEYGGPDGGNGGKGGDVIVRCVPNLNTLIDYRYRQHFKAKVGGHGMGKNRTGAHGADAVLLVPPGTQILAEDKESVLFDLVEPDQEVVLARGGIGGLGNAMFKSSINRAPKFAQPGEPGAEFWVWLQLKLIADVGLLGLPNAGKSSFLAAVSAAKPKVAAYPFTTLYPGLGMAESSGQRMLIADIPGLIEGAHTGLGLGDQFLRHIERCAVLIHLIDCDLPDPAAAYKAIRNECAQYSPLMAAKPEIVVLSKIDSQTETGLALTMDTFTEATGITPLTLSSHTRQGIEAVLKATLALKESVRPAKNEADTNQM
jgi:GTP-binding protein